jgi:Flp pilus assembly protein TadG
LKIVENHKISAQLQLPRFCGGFEMKTSLVSRVRSFLVSDSEGSALVEMAVTLPLMLLAMTGIFSFSLALYQDLQLGEAVSAAGHLLAVDRGDHDPCATAMAAFYNAAPGLSRSNLTVQITLNGNAETPSTSCPAGVAGDANPDLAQSTNAQITAYYPTTLNFVNIWGNSGGFGSITLGSQDTEVVQ